jgi:hypothetical protein
MRRFIEVRGQDGQWLVIDTHGEARILCTCTGWKAPLNAEYICKALEAYHVDLIARFLKLD